MKKISVAKDFSKFPAGRYLSDGPASGQAFRDTLLAPALLTGEPVEVDFEGTVGYGSSFLEEAFGGLVREHGLTTDQISRLSFKQTNEAHIKREAMNYIESELRRGVHYHTFVAVAMQDGGDPSEIKEFVALLEKECQPIYYAPRKYPTPGDWPLPFSCLKERLEGVQTADRFFLYYPDRVPSGSLVELGFAIALKKRIVVYTKELGNLPYLFRGGYHNTDVITGADWQPQVLQSLKWVHDPDLDPYG